MNKANLLRLESRVNTKVASLRKYPHKLTLENNRTQIVFRIKIKDKYYEPIIDIENKDTEDTLLLKVIEKIQILPLL